MNQSRSGRRHRLLSKQLVPAALFALGAVLILSAVVSPPPAPGGPVAADRMDRAPRPDVEDVPEAASSRRTLSSGTTPPRPAERIEESHTAASARGSSGPVALPNAVEIPRLDVQSTLVDLDLDDDRALQAPTDPDVAGWYMRGPRPGQPGPAVIAGHVDSYDGPAVFWRLAELEAGDRIVVHLTDGREVAFTVDEVGRWPKNDFPTNAVYRDADGPELRLITCGGTFDEDERSYRDNVIVFASAA